LTLKEFPFMPVAAFPVAAFPEYIFSLGNPVSRFYPIPQINFFLSPLRAQTLIFPTVNDICQNGRHNAAVLEIFIGRRVMHP